MKTIVLLAVIFLLCVSYSPCYTYSKSEQKDYRVILDASLSENSSVSAAWLAYAVTRGLWYEKTFLETFPDEKEYRYTFEEEVEAREFLAQVWVELSQKDTSIHDRYLDELVFVTEHGYLKEYVFFYFEDPQWGVDRNSLRMMEFIQWAQEHIPQHQPETLATISEITSSESE
ncbi:MAG: hypothetical protein JSW40_04190 [Candidatus Omnitrophota bacterium]|nr:MAG: hypothetical protein JSW40_04190 [Candidatus Omnitrophota bacterium]